MTEVAEAQAIREEEGPGKDPVRWTGIVGISSYVAALTAILLYVLLSLWPHPTPSGRPEETTATTTTATSAASQSPCAAAGNALLSKCEKEALVRACLVNKNDPSDPSCATIFGVDRIIWNETRLLLLVVLAGALGSLLHSVRSLYWYIGQRKLVRSWIAMYFLLPWSGSLLALVFYVVVRGGFFSPRAPASETSPFGFCALAVLAGMFSEPAVLKLRDVAATIFTKPQVGKDPAPADTGDGPSGSPVLSNLTPSQVAAGSGDTLIKLSGKGFDKDSTVSGNNTKLAATFATANELTATVPAAMLAKPGTIAITIKNPDGAESTSQDLTIT